MVGVAKDSVINLLVTGDYVVKHNSDISGIASQIGYNTNAPANWAKVFNANWFWRWRQENEGNPNIIPGYVIPQNARPLTANTLCHELGHLLGLEHTFSGGNGCQDVDYNQGASGNNLMDYVNANNYAVSPCQLDIMHGQLYNPSYANSDYRPYTTHSACDEVPPRAFFTMASTFADPTQVWMDGRGTYAADSWQLILYRNIPGMGPVRMATYTKRGGLGQRVNLYAVFSAYLYNGGDYRLDMRAVKQSGQFHVYRQAFSINPSNDPAPCDDCEPPGNPTERSIGGAAAVPTSSTSHP